MRLRRFGLLLAAASLAPCLAFADPVTFFFEPEVGATWKVTEIRNKTSSNPAKPSGEAVITATLKVIDATDDGYLMEWTTHTVSSGGVTLGAGGAAQPELLLGVPLRYTADSEALPIELLDFTTMLDQISGTIGADKDPAGKEKLKAFFNSMDGATRANLFLQEASIFGQCHNFEIDPAAPIKTQIYTPSPIGGTPILTNASVTLEHVGSQTEPARIVISQVQDPASAGASMIASIRKNGGEAAVAKAMPDGKMPAMQNTSTITCNIDTMTGEAVSITTVQDVISGNIALHDGRKLTFERQ